LISSGSSPDLVEDLVDLLAVDAHLVGQRSGLRVVHQVVEPSRNEPSCGRWCRRRAGKRLFEGFRAFPGGRWGRSRGSYRATASGTKLVHAPPNAATSLDALDETKLNCGRHHMHRLDLGASVRFRWFIWNSH
jgi:hypothetical protein